MSAISKVKTLQAVLRENQQTYSQQVAAQSRYLDQCRDRGVVSRKKLNNKSAASSFIVNQCLMLVPEDAREAPRDKRLSNREILKTMYPGISVTQILSQQMSAKASEHMDTELVHLGVIKPELIAKMCDKKSVRKAIHRLEGSSNLASRMASLLTLVKHGVTVDKYKDELKSMSSLMAA